MQNFTYKNPTQIEFGKDKEKEIGKHLHENGIKKVLLTFGSDRIKKDGLFDSVVASLQEYKIDFIELGGIISNPVLSKVYEGIKLAKEEHVDALLSVGGGSVLDNSKAIVVGAKYDGDVWDFFTKKAIPTDALPVYDIITLAATGSEMNCGCVITNEKTKDKFAMQHPSLYPKVSIINPELQMSVSKDYLVYSASDIIAHSIEAYFTASVHPNLISRQVEAVIKTVIETTEILLKNPTDYEARGDFAWAATCALNGTLTVGIEGFSFPNHMIEHILSALYNVPHGAGLSVVMPAWMKWYSNKNEAQFERFAKEIFGKNSAKEGIEALENWFTKIGTPTKLVQFKLGQSNIDEIVKIGVANLKTSPLGEVYTKEAFENILTKAL